MSENEDGADGEGARRKRTFDVRAPRVRRSTKDSAHFAAGAPASPGPRPSDATTSAAPEARRGGAFTGERSPRPRREPAPEAAPRAGAPAGEETSEPREGARRPSGQAGARGPRRDRGRPAWQDDRRLVPVRPDRMSRPAPAEGAPQPPRTPRDAGASAPRETPPQPARAREPAAPTTLRSATPPAPAEDDKATTLAIAAAPPVKVLTPKVKDKPRTAMEALRAKTAKAQASKGPASARPHREADEAEPDVTLRAESAPGDASKSQRKVKKKPSPAPEPEDEAGEADAPAPKKGFWQRVKALFGA